MDEFYEKIGHLVPKSQDDAELVFPATCFCSCEPDDLSLNVAKAPGSDEYLIWASDYLITITLLQGGRELREHCPGLPENAQRKIMGNNAARRMA